VFCPRCGAASAPEATFCEHCGERLAAEAAPTPVAAPAPAPPSSGGRRGWWIGGGVVVLLAVVAGVLALTGVLGKDDNKPVARHLTVASVPAPAPETAPAATTPPAATAPATTPTVPTVSPARSRRVVVATVARTCGAGGVGGDCHLSIRSQPSSDGSELQRLDEGDTVRLTCQVQGDAVTSSALGAASTVWSKTPHGGYVSNVYVKGPGLKPTRRTLPAC
jgi:zinc-ribbon domain